MGSRVRVIGPPTLIPAAVERLGVTVFHDMDAGLAGADIVMMLRLQKERMTHGGCRVRGSISASSAWMPPAWRARESPTRW